LIIPVAAPGCDHLDVTIHLLRRVGRVGVVQEVPEEMPVVGVHDGFGQVRQLE
jgi:hypothetical protein